MDPVDFFQNLDVSAYLSESTVQHDFDLLFGAQQQVVGWSRYRTSCGFDSKYSCRAAFIELTSHAEINGQRCTKELKSTVSVKGLRTLREHLMQATYADHGDTQKVIKSVEMRIQYSKKKELSTVKIDRVDGDGVPRVDHLCMSHADGATYNLLGNGAYKLFCSALAIRANDGNVPKQFNHLLVVDTDLCLLCPTKVTTESTDGHVVTVEKFKIDNASTPERWINKLNNDGHLKSMTCVGTQLVTVARETDADSKPDNIQAGTEVEVSARSFATVDIGNLFGEMDSGAASPVPPRAPQPPNEPIGGGDDKLQIKAPAQVQDGVAASNRSAATISVAHLFDQFTGSSASRTAEDSSARTITPPKDYGRLVGHRHSGQTSTRRLSDDVSSGGGDTVEAERRLHRELGELKHRLPMATGDYLRSHPELVEVLTDYLCSLFTAMPDDVAQFSSYYFQMVSAAKRPLKVMPK